ncbi:gp436 family protein [Burkholderia ambifaria]|uniref:gp436 family protein n=1 Tax=Burkholderia ambifaria TaxID=152480 RepID=UPI001588A556|nr:DUF1320 domain-containing protein [Burkholderia ambifaria]
MTYCTRTDLVERFGEAKLEQVTHRSDDFGTAPGPVDEQRVTAAIEDADDEINGYLRGIYPVPLADVPKSIKRCAVDVAWYYLHANNVSELVKERYEAAIKFLRLIADGKVHLGVETPDGDELQPGAANVSWFCGTRPKVFKGGLF